MERRDSLKYIFLGSVAGGLTLHGCRTETEQTAIEEPPKSEEHHFGRTPEEKERLEKLYAETFFNKHEMDSITALSALILPANDNFGSAVDAGVPDFIEFIVKDMPQHQLPLRGGLMWLDHRSNYLHAKDFKSLESAQQTAMLDEIAYIADDTPDELLAGATFFRQIRNLVLTGYYTSEIGIEDLGYQGNRPNVWDGVPQDVLDAHGVAYEPEWLAKCVDQSKRGVTADWDAEGNLIT